ncbi:hypothetical protein HOG17_04730 [Candidatus Peregrinibacteria bacterium]|jgi:hypothetical protein|nr:hypothetical protein [Candidatus Peregrinibacteria bacterium]MBT4147871.1 hypothetical protein [Candidatus Peregrinibacteria bacterium]MBT4366078.1 hypothetical protein [Candidatus Peregrinibacteria bacterium]MBT4455855.1 hypothetical protein [Candidatus Peregrinibacteria bacterium]
MLLKFLQILPLLEILILIPLAMYGIGKLLKIESPMFKFKNCVWMIFIAGLLAGFAAEVNLWVGAAVFLALMSFMVWKQFKATAVQIVVLLVAVLVISLGLEFLRSEVTKMVLIDKFGGVEDLVPDEDPTEGEDGFLFSRYGDDYLRKIYMEFSLAQEYSEIKAAEDDELSFTWLYSLYAEKLREKHGLSKHDYTDLMLGGNDKGWDPEYGDDGLLVHKGYIDDYDAFILELESYLDSDADAKKGPSVNPVE